MASSGVTAAQAAVLQLVGEGKANSQKRLAVLLQQNESAIAQMLARLESAGLVERRYSSEDRRRRDFKLTPAGEVAVRDGARAFEALNASLDAIVPEGEQVALVNWLDEIAGIGSPREN